MAHLASATGAGEGGGGGRGGNRGGGERVLPLRQPAAGVCGGGAARRRGGRVPLPDLVPPHARGGGGAQSGFLAAHRMGRGKAGRCRRTGDQALAAGGGRAARGV